MDTSLPHGEIQPKLLLLDPYPRNNPYRMTASERRSIWFPKLSLPAIAAYTPTTWDVEIVDEAVTDIDLETPCDVVGVSIMTCYAPRAYEIADEFRRRRNWSFSEECTPPIAQMKPFAIAMPLSAEKPKTFGFKSLPTSRPGP